MRLECALWWKAVPAPLPPPVRVTCALMIPWCRCSAARMRCALVALWLVMTLNHTQKGIGAVGMDWCPDDLDASDLGHRQGRADQSTPPAELGA